MATVLKDFEFGASRGRPEMYPWATWFDGKIRRLERGKDFEGHPANFRVQVFAAAKRYGVKVQTSVEKNLDQGVALVIKATKEKK